VERRWYTPVPMKQSLRAFMVTVALSAPGVAFAAELEIAGHAGFTFPFYSQTFSYDPGSVTVPIPGVSVEESGQFQLNASGGPAFAGAITLYATKGLGFEFRLDHVDMKVDNQGGSYSVRVGLPAPLDPVVANLSLTQGTADVNAASPFSLNLKLRSGGPVRLTASFGASHLGNLDMTLTQSVGLGVIGFDFVQGSAQIATLQVKASAVGGTQSSWGANLGLGLEIPIGRHGAFLIEGRGFYFGKRTVEWEPVIDRPLSSIEEMLLQRLQERLPAVEFEPWWVQATIGFAVRF
jgi:hypothetical protein